MQQMEIKPMYKLFSSAVSHNEYGLADVKRVLVQNEYAAKEVWINDVTEFFNTIINLKTESILYVHCAKTMLDWFQRKVDKIRELDIETWKREVCESYQRLNKLVAKAPASLGISKVQKPMQMLNQEITFTETELAMMKTQIEHLDENDQELIINIVTEMETSAQKNGDFVTFDLEKMKPSTLFSIQALLKRKNKLTARTICL